MGGLALEVFVQVLVIWIIFNLGRVFGVEAPTANLPGLPGLPLPTPVPLPVPIPGGATTTTTTTTPSPTTAPAGRRRRRRRNLIDSGGFFSLYPAWMSFQGFHGSTPTVARNRWVPSINLNPGYAKLALDKFSPYNISKPSTHTTK